MLNGETLRLIRLMKSIKQETMACALHISQPAYCKMEKYRYIQGERLEQIFKILNCTKEDIEHYKSFLPPK